MQQQYLIIVAGGTGTRMQNDVPKQFVKLNGKEIIIRSIEKFISYNKNLHIIIVVHENYLDLLKELLKRYNLLNINIVAGGETRYHSVKNGLGLINESNALVGIHDAARPLVSELTIRRCFEVAAVKGNAVPCLPVSDSLREVINEKNQSVKRNNFRIIQTPQCFLASQLKIAFQLPYSDNFTDDASVVEASGIDIHLVEGNEENIKITLPKDLLIAKIFLENE
ncbi:MAG: 2-C-methyl-D-erythritol 4-phosphate cytidylyltransferase [Bacteroidetes bacterium]|nr:2-C-methyl-D-erythritol 4-phosphate cytidylyltransferase [Bacteroidota bacterium]